MDINGFDRKEAPSIGREGGGSWRNSWDWSGRERWGVCVKEREVLGGCKGAVENRREGGKIDLGAGNLMESLGNDE